MKERLIIGISGASGFIYGYRLLELLQDHDVETHLVLSKAAHQTRAIETEYTAKEVTALADVHYASDDIAAAISSGSFLTKGMIIAPCSVSTAASIASGNTRNLLTRAADVVLKERRLLAVMIRESPLHQGHLENLTKLSQMGASICPPVPAFYNHPQSIEDIIDHSIGRVLDLFGIDLDIVQRWK